MKKALIIGLVVIPILGVAGYWGYNEFMLASLEKSIGQAQRQLDSRAESGALLTSLATLADAGQRAQSQKMPVFEPKYDALKKKSEEAVRNAPSSGAKWVAVHRSLAWSAVGSEMRPRSEVDDKSLVCAARGLKSVCETGLGFQDKVASAAKRLGIETGQVQGMSDIASEIKKTATQAEQMAEVGKKMSSLKGRAKGKVQEGLKKIDRANRKIEKFAEVSTLRRVCYDWDSALSTIKESGLFCPRFPVSVQGGKATWHKPLLSRTVRK